MKKLLNVLLSTILFIVVFTINVNANYTFTVSSSNSEVNPGGSFTVTVKVPGSGMFYASASNGSVSPSSQYCDTSCTFNAVAGTSGKTEVTITAGTPGTSDEVNPFDNEDATITGSKSVIVGIKSNSSGSSGGSTSGSSSSGTTTPSKPSVNYSKDNNLKSLTISEGTLSPAFSASTTSYTVELGATVKSLKVDAVANDKKASVKGTGTKELEPGENTIKITVTAENGNPKVYTITAIVDEKPLVFLPYNGGELGVVRNLKDVPKLDGFEETKVVINGNETRAWHSSTRNITLIYLQNGDSKDFYIYDEAKSVISIYKPLGILGNNLGIIDIPEELKNKAAMQFGEVEVDGLTLNGWTYDNEMFKNYSLIYAMDESGNYNYYQYEKTQNTLQLYSGAAPILQEDYDTIVKENEKMTMYFYIACGVAVVSVVLAIVGFVNANKYKNRLLKRNEVKVD